MKLSETFRIVCAMLALVTCGCVPEFENPLPPPADLKSDAKLIGNWVCAMDTNETSQLSVFARPSGWMDFVYVTQYLTRGDKRADVMAYEGYATQIGKNKFLSLRARVLDSDKSEGTNGTYVLAYYNAGRSRLDLSFFSQSKVKALMQSGELEGKIVKGAYTADVTVTAASSNLLSLISAKGVDAFVDNDDGSIKFKFSRAKK